MHIASINGIQMAYRDEGAGQPLLLVHAFPFSGAMWQPQISALSATNRVIAPDLRGFGASEFGDGVASLDDYAADLVALLDQLAVPQAAVCGLSMGGYVTFALLRRAAERISALVLADTRAGADSAEVRQAREQNARMVEQQGLEPLAEQMLPTLLAARTPPAQRDIVRGLITTNPPAGVAAALRAMAQRPDSKALLGNISVPTLIIVGTEDTLTPPSEAQRMHDGIAGSRLVKIDGAAHLSNLEAPDLFNAAVADLLGSHGEQAFGTGGRSGGAW